MAAHNADARAKAAARAAAATPSPAPAAAPGAPDFGPLAGLAGNWKGVGFAQVTVPDRSGSLPFKVMVSATTHSLSYVPLTSPILNRGSSDSDINMGGLQYTETVADTASGRVLHVEPGSWLHEPSGAISRAGVVPHGNAFVASGASRTIQGAPQIADADTTPFTLDANGNRNNDTNDFYIAPFKTTGLPPGIPAGAVLNPNKVLQDANKQLLSTGHKFISTIELKVAANPVGGVDGTPLKPNGAVQGGITNTAFINNNAAPTSLTATFWLSKVQAPDGSTFDQLQISQTVIMDFIGIKWPHTTVATLRREAN